MLAQLHPVVKPIADDLSGIRLVCFHFAQGVVPIVFNELRIDRADKDALIVEKAGRWFIVSPGVFHDHPCFTLQAFQAVCQLLEPRLSHSNSFGNDAEKTRLAAVP